MIRRRTARKPSQAIVQAAKRDPEAIATLVESLLGALVAADDVIHHAAVCGAEESLALWNEGRHLWTQLRDLVAES